MPQGRRGLAPNPSCAAAGTFLAPAGGHQPPHPGRLSFPQHGLWDRLSSCYLLFKPFLVLCIALLSQHFNRQIIDARPLSTALVRPRYGPRLVTVHRSIARAHHMVASASIRRPGFRSGLRWAHAIPLGRLKGRADEPEDEPRLIQAAGAEQVFSARDVEGVARREAPGENVRRQPRLAVAARGC